MPLSAILSACLVTYGFHQGALDGAVIGKCPPRHRNEEFIAFLEYRDARVGAELDIHLILDNYAAYKTSERQGLACIPSAIPRALHSNEFVLAQPGGTFFGEITSRRIRRGSFRGVRELIRASEAYIADRNRNPKRFCLDEASDYDLAARQDQSC